MTKRANDIATAKAVAAETAAATAAALALKAQATADALAQAKVASDIAFATAKAEADKAAALLAADLTQIKITVAKIEAALSNGYVTQERFRSFETDLAAQIKLAELHAARLTTLETNQNINAGKGDGMKSMYGWIAAGISALIGIAAFVIPHWK